MNQQDLLRALEYTFFSQTANDVNFLSNWLFFFFLPTSLLYGSPHIELQVSAFSINVSLSYIDLSY